MATSSRCQLRPSYQGRTPGPPHFAGTPKSAPADLLHHRPATGTQRWAMSTLCLSLARTWIRMRCTSENLTNIRPARLGCPAHADVHGRPDLAPDPGIPMKSWPPLPPTASIGHSLERTLHRPPWYSTRPKAALHPVSSPHGMTLKLAKRCLEAG